MTATGPANTTMTCWIRDDEEAMTQWAGTTPPRRIKTAAKIAAQPGHYDEPGQASDAHRRPGCPGHEH